MEHLKLLPLYEVNIDFDKASNAWKSNKKSIGNGIICIHCGATLKKMGKMSTKPKKRLYYMLPTQIYKQSFINCASDFSGLCKYLHFNNFIITLFNSSILAFNLNK